MLYRHAAFAFMACSGAALSLQSYGARCTYVTSGLRHKITLIAEPSLRRGLWGGRPQAPCIVVILYSIFHASHLQCQSSKTCYIKNTERGTSSMRVEMMLQVFRDATPCWEVITDVSEGLAAAVGCTPSCCFTPWLVSRKVGVNKKKRKWNIKL